MAQYLCYDIRGIQSFIFRIPKLKYIIGGSALVDRFDRETAKNAAVDGAEYLYSGGGKGTYLCNSDTVASSVKEKLITKAREIGLDIRFGLDGDFEKASRDANELYAFMPELSGTLPCKTSGMYPVKKTDLEHEVVAKRLRDEDGKSERYFEERLSPKDVDHVALTGKDLRFFRDVSGEGEDSSDDGKRGSTALGKRNRWAVICMDGNDMGSQLRKMTKEIKPDPDAMTTWLKAMSEALDTCTVDAAKAGISRVVAEWAASKDFDPKSNDGTVVLPIRPLVVGGDDIIVLCHVSYAMTFVKEACRVFALKSRELNEAHSGDNLWPATGGEVTISAGVLYCPVSLPLHTAIGYGESLLASAKSRGRKEAVEGKPSPASIDWEQVTDSIIDTPSARRQRELIFKEGDKTIKLTTRPCTMNEYGDIEKLARDYGGASRGKKVPPTVRHRILPALKKPLSQRIAFAAQIAKNHPELAAHIADSNFEIGKGKSRWRKDGDVMVTDVIDAMMLLEEDRRMEKETVNG